MWTVVSLLAFAVGVGAAINFLFYALPRGNKAHIIMACAATAIFAIIGVAAWQTNKPLIVLQMRNHGPTHATLTGFAFCMHGAKAAVVPRDVSYAPRQVVHAETHLAADAGAEHVFLFNEPQKLAGVMAGEIPLFVWGYVEYLDAVPNERITGFGVEYVPLLGGFKDTSVNGYNYSR